MPWFINSMMKKIWKKMARKPYRDGYVSASIPDTIAAQITKLRNARGWAQTELARRAGMKQSRISALEDPNWDNVETGTLERIASAFDVALVVRFAPFSELAQWSATLTDDKLVVRSYEEEVEEAAFAARFVSEPDLQSALNSMPPSVAIRLEESRLPTFSLRGELLLDQSSGVTAVAVRMQSSAPIVRTQSSAPIMVG